MCTQLICLFFVKANGLKIKRVDTGCFSKNSGFQDAVKMAWWYNLFKYCFKQFFLQMWVFSFVPVTPFCASVKLKLDFLEKKLFTFLDSWSRICQHLGRRLQEHQPDSTLRRCSGVFQHRNSPLSQGNKQFIFSKLLI